MRIQKIFRTKFIYSLSQFIKKYDKKNLIKKNIGAGKKCATYDTRQQKEKKNKKLLFYTKFNIV